MTTSTEAKEFKQTILLFLQEQYQTTSMYMIQIKTGKY